MLAPQPLLTLFPDVSSPETNEGDLLAAVDLGSNSFHLIVARMEHGEIRPVHTLAEKVQLGAGLVDHHIAQDAIDRGLVCLERFAQLLQNVDPRRIRVVGTNALRQAQNRRDFTGPAGDILGVPVDVVYGREEARLVYLGVAHTLADDETSRLVIDIGGGSTEFIIGQRFEPRRLESLQLGCVSYAQDYFPEGVISRDNFARAFAAARLEISHMSRNYQRGFWTEAVGSSGTLQAIETLIALEGWRENGIDYRSLEKLKKRLLKYENSSDIDIDGLSGKRKHVITSGVAIAMAIFEGLNIETMRTSKGALREGVIYDLVGRLSHEDVRERSVNAMVARYGADPAAAEVVGDRVMWLAQSVAVAWELTARDIEMLFWAGKCHEIGAAISQKHYHRHSAYLLENSDMAGFSQGEQEILAALVRVQRGKIERGAFESFSSQESVKLFRMVALLRCAVVLKHAELLGPLGEFSIEASDQNLMLALPDPWREKYPLTTHELEQSVSALSRLNITLKVS